MFSMLSRRSLSGATAAFAGLAIAFYQFDGAEGSEVKAQAPAAEHKDVYAVITIHTAPPQIVILAASGWRDCQHRLPGVKAVALRAFQAAIGMGRGVISPEQLTGTGRPDLQIAGSCEMAPMARVDAR